MWVILLQLDSKIPIPKKRFFIQWKKNIYFQNLLPYPDSYSHGPFLLQMPLHLEVLLGSRIQENFCQMLIKACTKACTPFSPSRKVQSVLLVCCIALQISFYRHIIATNSLQTADSPLGTSKCSRLELQTTQRCCLRQVFLFNFSTFFLDKLILSPKLCIPPQHGSFIYYILPQYDRRHCWKHDKYLGWLSSEQK